MPKTSSGLLLYRLPEEDAGSPEVLLVHPGGPLWSKKDEGAWSIPKGEHDPGDDPALCARREFEEELGAAPPPGPWLDLGAITQSGGKRVRAWALRGELDVRAITSNTFEMQWPPRSGRYRSFPEVDKAEWFPLDRARRKLNPAQCALLDRLVALLARS